MGDNTLFKIYRWMGLSEYDRDFNDCSLLDYIKKEGMSLEKLIV